MSQPFAAELIRTLRERQGEEFELHRRHVNPAFVDLLSMAGYARRFVRAHGLELQDEHGDTYLDFLSGYGVHNLGHNHPEVRAAIEAVLSADVPGFLQVDFNLLEGVAAEALAKAMPGDLDKVFFCNSGAEAIEAGLKLARAATGRTRFLCCEHAYHGLTLGTLSLNGNAALREPFEPLLSGVDRIPFGDLGALERALAPGNVAAFVVEPILGEGGAIVPPDEYLRQALALCRRRGALLLLDEVQTGLGRTGRMLAAEHAGVVPDAVALAKSLGGGLMPVGALVARGDVFARAYGSPRTCQGHNTTFGGGPLAMAAVLATLHALRAENLVENARVQGDYLRARLLDLAARHRSIREVRGRGLLLALRFEDATRGLLDRTLLQALGDASTFVFAQHVAIALMDKHHIVTQAAVNDMGVLKVMPPLMVTREQIDRFVAALDAVLAETGPVRAMASMAAAVVRNRRAG